MHDVYLRAEVKDIESADGLRRTALYSFHETIFGEGATTGRVHEDWPQTKDLAYAGGMLHALKTLGDTLPIRFYLQNSNLLECVTARLTKGEDLAWRGNPCKRLLRPLLVKLQGHKGVVTFATLGKERQ